METRIIEVSVTARELRAMPDAVRHTFLLLSHGMNELSFIHRLIFAISNVAHPIGPEHNINFSQALFVLRLHISKIYEVWKLVKSSKKHWKRFLGALEKDAQDTYRDLVDHFQGQSLLAVSVRNRYGFHYPDEQIYQKNYLKHHDNDDRFVFYVHQTRMNSNYFLSDFLLFQLMREDIFGNCEDRNMTSHFGTLSDESAALNLMMMNFLEPLVGEMIKAYLPDAPGRTKFITVKTTSADDLQLPFFLEVSTGVSS